MHESLAVALACAGCGGERLVRPGEAWVLCIACRLATEIGVPAPRELPLRFVAPFAGPKGPAVGFFRFPGLRVEARAESASGEAAAGRLAEISVGWAVAMRVRGFHAFGDAGVEYTRRPPRFELAADVGEPPLPLTRTLEDAEAVLRVSLLRLAWEVAPSASVSVRVDPGPAEIWCVTTQADGTHVKFPHSGVRAPRAALS